MATLDPSDTADPESSAPFDGSGGVSVAPTNTPTDSNQTGWLDEMAAAAWPSGVWSQTGVGTAPVAITAGVTAWGITLTSGQRVELRSLLAPTRLDSSESTTRLLFRATAASTQELILGAVNNQSDTIGTAPTDGVWIQRDSSGNCTFKCASASTVLSVALAFALPTEGYFDAAIEVRTAAGGFLEAIAYVSGVPVASHGDVVSPTGWLWPRAGAKGTGLLALDRMGRATVGLVTGEYL